MKKGAAALGRGRIVTKEQAAPLVTNLMHWLYGVSCGVAYGVASRRVRPDPAAGPVAAAYATLER